MPPRDVDDDDLEPEEDKDVYQDKEEDYDDCKSGRKRSRSQFIDDAAEEDEDKDEEEEEDDDDEDYGGGGGRRGGKGGAPKPKKRSSGSHFFDLEAQVNSDEDDEGEDGLGEAAKMAEQMEAAMMKSLGLPTSFNSSQEVVQPKKPVATNLPRLMATKRAYEVLDFVNQLVFTNCHSFRPRSGLVRRDLELLMPLPRLIIHNLWPSSRNSGSKSVTITPIMPISKVNWTNIPLDGRVPRVDPHSIHSKDRLTMNEIWFSMIEAVGFNSFHNYTWYKHLQFNKLDPSINVWSKVLGLSVPVLKDDVHLMDCLMAHLLSLGYTVGLTYNCLDFICDINNFFGVQVHTVFDDFKDSQSGVVTRIWKEVRLLYDAVLENLIPFNDDTVWKPGRRATFLFENIATRSDLPHVPLF